MERNNRHHIQSRGIRKDERFGKITKGVSNITIMFFYLKQTWWGWDRSERGENSTCWKHCCRSRVAAPVFGWQRLCILEPGQTVGRGKASFYLLFSHRVFCSPVPTHSWVTNFISQSNSEGSASSCHSPRFCQLIVSFSFLCCEFPTFSGVF